MFAIGGTPTSGTLSPVGIREVMRIATLTRRVNPQEYRDQLGRDRQEAEGWWEQVG